MSVYAWMFLNKQNFEYVSGRKIQPSCQKLWIWQSSKYDRVLNKWALHNVLNCQKYVLTVFWIHLKF